MGNKEKKFCKKIIKSIMLNKSKVQNLNSQLKNKVPSQASEATGFYSCFFFSRSKSKKIYRKKIFFRIYKTKCQASDFIVSRAFFYFFLFIILLSGLKAHSAMISVCQWQLPQVLKNHKTVDRAMMKLLKCQLIL